MLDGVKLQNLVAIHVDYLCFFHPFLIEEVSLHSLDSHSQCLIIYIIYT